MKERWKLWTKTLPKQSLVSSEVTLVRNWTLLKQRKKACLQWVRSNRGPRLYRDVRAAIEEEVRQRWLNGIPITRPEIYRLLKRRFVTGDQRSVSQSIPKGWKDLAIAGAARGSQTRFHESSSKVLAPKGAKRVGTAIKCNDKEGCTVMVCKCCHRSYYRHLYLERLWRKSGRIIPSPRLQTIGWQLRLIFSMVH